VGCGNPSIAYGRTATAYAYFQVEVPDHFRENPTGLLGTTYTHPDDNPNTLDNDVGVAVLEQAVQLSQYPVLAPEGSSAI